MAARCSRPGCSTASTPAGFATATSCRSDSLISAATITMTSSTTRRRGMSIGGSGDAWREATRRHLRIHERGIPHPRAWIRSLATPIVRVSRLAEALRDPGAELLAQPLVRHRHRVVAASTPQPQEDSLRLAGHRRGRGSGAVVGDRRRPRPGRRRPSDDRTSRPRSPPDRVVRLDAIGPRTARRGRHEAARRHRRPPGRPASRSGHRGPARRRSGASRSRRPSGAPRTRSSRRRRRSPSVRRIRAGRTPRTDRPWPARRNSISSSSANSTRRPLVGPGAVGHHPDLVHVDVGDMPVHLGDVPAGTGWNRGFETALAHRDHALGVGVDEREVALGSESTAS